VSGRYQVTAKRSGATVGNNKTGQDRRAQHSTGKCGTSNNATHFPAPATSSSEGNRMDILLRGIFPTRKLSVDPFSTGSTSPARGRQGEEEEEGTKRDRGMEGMGRRE
jgi:hypothetical protein